MVVCVGCGVDVSSSSRRNLNEDSTAAAGPRENVVSAWLSIVRKLLQVQGLSVADTCIDPSNPGRMCKCCFAGFERLHKLQVQLEGKVAIALQQLSSTATQAPPQPHRRIDSADQPVECPTTPILAPPPRKRMRQSDVSQPEAGALPTTQLVPADQPQAAAWPTTPPQNRMRQSACANRPIIASSTSASKSPMVSVRI